MDRRRLLLVALAFALVALLAPWFSFDDAGSSNTHTTMSWSPLWSSHCSDFARDSFECRYWPLGWDDLEVDWELIPIYLVLRFVALLANLALVALLGRAVAKKDARSVGAAGGICFMIFAIFIASLPGDMQYRAMTLTIGAYAALFAAAVALVHDLAPRREVVVAGAAAALALWSSLWLPWKSEVDAIWPKDPKEQSAHRWGLIATTHDWHDFRHERRHYMEDALSREALADFRWHHVTEDAPGVLAAAAGVVVAALLLRRMRGGDAHVNGVRVAAGLFALGGVAFYATRDAYSVAIPGSGAVAGVLVAAYSAAGLFVSRKSLSIRDGRQSADPGSREGG